MTMLALENTFPVALPEGFDAAELKALVPADMWEKDAQTAAILALRRSGKFDEAWYLERYPDVRESGMDAVEHYVRFGSGEGRYIFNLLKNSDSKPRIIISLTSYSTRVKTVHKTIKSLLTQTVKNYFVILWLASSEFKNKEKDLPQDLLNLRSEKFEILWTNDIKSYKKLIPALKKFPNDIIITADDDLYYEKDWIEKLYDGYKNNPTCISCHRVHRIIFNNKQKIMPYKKWNLEYNISCISYLNFLTGGAGALYPPHSLHKDVFREEIFMDLCNLADDIWFWAMAIRNNTKIYKIADCTTKLNFVEKTQDATEGAIPLWKLNYSKSYNDKQMERVLNFYPEIQKKLQRENFLPMVTVIIPIFNTGIYLNECLNSIILQDFQDIEILCIDDGSTDKMTKKILSDYAKKDIRIRVFKQKNAGPGAARNLGIKNARGKYIIFIDADDYISYNYVRNLFICAEKNKADIVATNAVTCFSRNGDKRDKNCGIPNNKIKMGQYDCAKAIIATGVSCNKIYNRKFLINNKIFYLDKKACSSEDNYFTDKAIIFGHKNFFIENNSIYFYRQSGNSITKSLTEQSIADMAYVYERIIKEFEDIEFIDKSFWINTIKQRALRDYRYSCSTLQTIDKNVFFDKKLNYEINVCCIMDSGYIIPAMALCKSIKQTKSKFTKINMYVIMTDIDITCKQRLYDMSDDYFNINIIEKDCSNLKSLHKYKKENDFCMATPTALLKFLIPNILYNLDRVIYIDTDAIVIKDLLELYQSPVDENYLGVVIDLWSTITKRNVQSDKYFNSGVMVMNLHQMRIDDISKKLLHEKSITKDFSLMDQDIFNKVCQNKFITLELKYNFLPTCYSRHKRKFNLNLLNSIYKAKYSTIEDLTKNNVIIHFAGSEKPWKNTKVLFYEKWKTFSTSK